MLQVVGLAAAGCATSEMPPLAAEHRQAMRNIAVLTTGPTERVNAETPVVGESAGAATAAGQTLAAGFCSGSASMFVLTVLATPVAAAVGASKARTAGEVIAAEKSLGEALARMKPRERVGEAMIAAGVPGKSLRKYDGTSAPHDLAQAHTKGVDAVLQIVLQRYGFITDGNIDPDIYPAIVAEVRVVRTRDAAELYRRRLGHVGASRKYFELAAHGAAVEPAFDAVYAALAAKIVRHVFGEAAAPSYATGSAPEAKTLRFFNSQPERGWQGCR